MTDRTRSAAEQIASGQSVPSLALSENARRDLAGNLVIAATKSIPGGQHPNRAIFREELEPFPASTMTTR